MKVVSVSERHQHRKSVELARKQRVRALRVLIGLKAHPWGSCHPAHGAGLHVSPPGQSVPVPATLQQGRSQLSTRAVETPAQPWAPLNQTHLWGDGPGLSLWLCPAITELRLTPVPLAGPDPDPHLQADVPAWAWPSNIPMEVHDAWDWGCPCLPTSGLPCSLAGVVGWTRADEAFGVSSPPCCCSCPDPRELLAHGAP